MFFMPCFMLFVALSVPGEAQVAEIEELQFLSIHVLKGYHRQFDLSGIAYIEGHYWVINDKPWSHLAYKINLEDNSFHLTDSIELGIDYRSDLEGIDYCHDLNILFTDEAYNRAYQLAGPGKSALVFDKNQLRNDLDWGENKGLEGIAVDCQENVLYLAKERQPRFIIVYHLGEREITDIIDLEASGDISDLKFDGGYLYILERNNNLVVKMDPKTKQIVSRTSYKKTCSHPRGKLYENSMYGMAEALLLTPEEIWIGLDNNGMPFSNHASETYGLYGNKPVIIKFKRPVGF